MRVLLAGFLGGVAALLALWSQGALIAIAAAPFAASTSAAMMAVYIWFRERGVAPLAGASAGTRPGALERAASSSH